MDQENRLGLCGLLALVVSVGCGNDSPTAAQQGKQRPSASSRLTSHRHDVERGTVGLLLAQLIQARPNIVPKHRASVEALLQELWQSTCERPTGNPAIPKLGPSVFDSVLFEMQIVDCDRISTVDDRVLVLQDSKWVPCHADSLTGPCK